MWWRKKALLTDDRLSNTGVRMVFKHVRSDRVITPDLWYALPKAEDFIAEVNRRYWKVMTGNNILSWKKHHDCDNKAMAWKTVADAVFSQNNTTENDGVAAGIIFYVQASGTGHAINFVINADRKVIFVEPQTMKEVQLTGAEQASINWVYV
jgi:hypothetical protein